MEGGLRVLRETAEEQLEERIHVLSGCVASVDRRTIIRVGVSDVHRLIEEEDVAVGIPGMFIVHYSGFVGNLAGTQLKEQSRS